MIPLSPTSFYQWVRWNLRKQRDVCVELRGPKGYGKSALALWMRQRIDPQNRTFEDLVFSHKDYVNRYRQIGKERRSGDGRVKFLWVDDATRIFNRRNALSKKNIAILDLNRTMRDSHQAVQLLLTQDDLLERPLMQGGPYALFVFDRPYHCRFVRFKNDPLYSEFKVRKMWAMKWPKPEKVYPNLWSTYQAARRVKTTALSQELLENLNRKPGQLGAPKSVDFLRYGQLLNEKKSKREIASIMGVSERRVYQVEEQIGNLS